MLPVPDPGPGKPGSPAADHVAGRRALDLYYITQSAGRQTSTSSVQHDPRQATSEVHQHVVDRYACALGHEVGMNFG